MATAISDRTPSVSVEYENRGKRATKKFDDANAAKKFYAAKDKAGKKPKVTAGKLPASDKADASASDKTDAKPVGVSKSTTARPFLAAQILAKHGLEVGVTDLMVEELDALVVETGSRSKANPRESRFCLGNAWHTLAGYEAAKS